MSLGTEVGLGEGDIVLEGDPAPPRQGAQHPPFFRTTALVRSPISATDELFGMCNHQTTTAKLMEIF